MILLPTNFEPGEPWPFASLLLVMVLVKGVRLEPEHGSTARIACSFQYTAKLFGVGVVDNMAGCDFSEDCPASLVLFGYF